MKRGEPLSWAALLLAVPLLMWVIGCASSAPPSRTLTSTEAPPTHAPDDEVVGVWSPLDPVEIPLEPVYLSPSWTKEQVLAALGQFLLVETRDLVVCTESNAVLRHILESLNAALAARLEPE
jgi:hypothetical protein